MKVAIVGFAVEGRANYQYFKKLGAEITICNDSNVDIPDGANSQLGENYLDNLDQFDLIVRTAGLNPSKILDKNPNVKDKITTTINEFLKISPTKNIIGVTGTKGKGTTSTLIYKIIEAHEKKVFIAGNIGSSPLEIIDQLDEDSWVVLELSSFQLCDIKLAPHIMACLMVVPEHLDWHKDLEDYINAKKQVFLAQKHDDIAIFNPYSEFSIRIADGSVGTKIPYLKTPGAYIENSNIKIDDITICNVDEVKLLGEHNLENVCASITTVWQAGFKNSEAIAKVINEFSGLEMRLELIKEVNGVKYFNDSFGTTPETAIVALKSIKEPKILIAGGSDKGADYAEMAKEISNQNVKAVISIGITGPKIAELLKNIKPELTIIEGLDKMPEIVSKASSIATPGDAVLLSCGSASFGLFENYKDRGNQFNQAVRLLA